MRFWQEFKLSMRKRVVKKWFSRGLGIPPWWTPATNPRRLDYPVQVSWSAGACSCSFSADSTLQLTCLTSSSLFIQRRLTTPEKSWCGSAMIERTVDNLCSQSDVQECEWMSASLKLTGDKSRSMMWAVRITCLDRTQRVEDIEISLVKKKLRWRKCYNNEQKLRDGTYGSLRHDVSLFFS